MTRFADVGPENFRKRWDRDLKRLKPGDVLCNGFVYNSDSNSLVPSPVDVSLEQAEAVFLFRKFGALKDDTLERARWVLDWSDMGPLPRLRLSPDLFRYLDEAELSELANSRGAWR